MTQPYWKHNGSKLYQGHVLDVLRALFEAGIRVHCTVTSPPYYGLRSYGLPPVEWPAVSYSPMAGLPEIKVPGCDPGCAHEWQVQKESKRRQTNLGNGGTIDPDRNDWIVSSEIESGWCHLCGGWRGCLGLEPTVEMFVGHIILIWRALWRVLRDDGTCWLNLGDSMSKGGGKQVIQTKRASYGLEGMRQETPGLSSKNLLGIPWRVAFALQADGWYLRSAAPWIKANCMPESVRDRCTTAHEYWFQLAKSGRYYWDPEAVRNTWKPESIQRDQRGYDGSFYSRTRQADPNDNRQTGLQGKKANYSGRNRRTSDFWNESLEQSIGIYDSYLAHLRHVQKHQGMLLSEAGEPLSLQFTTKGYKGAHFATFNGDLIRPLILSSSSEKGCCPECEAPWERVIEKGLTAHTGETQSNYPKGTTANRLALLRQEARKQGQEYTNETKTTGWRPTCSCCEPLPNGIDTIPFEPMPCTILDPFLGSGTTADVARQLGRRWIGIELSEDYCKDHIIPRLTEPLLEWAEQEEQPDNELVEIQASFAF